MLVIKRTSLIALLLVSYLFIYAQQPHSLNTSFKVSGVCIQCKHRIEKALKIKGVQSAHWDIPSHTLSLTYDPSLVSLDQVHHKLAEAGHDTELEKAKDDAYNALPECCHYREMTAEAAIAQADTSDNTVLRGIVVETGNSLVNPLAGATLSWAGTTHSTVTNPHGEFMLKRNDKADRMIVSYAGFATDTVSIGVLNDIQVSLSKKENLSNVIITARQRTSYIDGYDPFRTTIMTKKELLKAACCNLSESFETNPSVDVSYSDAVTGSKQIQLLGLAGVYTQLTVENLPGPRGLATALGLNSIPGTWIESMQLSKGNGSVANGYESIAGQINVELKKHAKSERLYAN